MTGYEFDRLVAESQAHRDAERARIRRIDESHRATLAERGRKAEANRQAVAVVRVAFEALRAAGDHAGADRLARVAGLKAAFLTESQAEHAAALVRKFRTPQPVTESRADDVRPIVESAAELVRQAARVVGDGRRPTVKETTMVRDAEGEIVRVVTTERPVE